jgi:hypothetical protein
MGRRCLFTFLTGFCFGRGTISSFSTTAEDSSLYTKSLLIKGSASLSQHFPLEPSWVSHLDHWLWPWIHFWQFHKNLLIHNRKSRLIAAEISTSEKVTR